ncbi:TetR/AcrR family transcriptional regulator [Miniphocaeibacter massiliensis]|uniref:TetR/AcrR family transcriptional regulator n=1 Tax=Miniphocaeibacter massiliensis TaxID=2041841 RepID=UPI000C1BB1C8|nr:TetR/AcrR family transcriptional regulator [Miniphocaeibacter massiliensis]
MADILDSKNIIINSFKNLLISKNLSKVTVSEIVKESKLSRQTFYRHFSGIDELIYFSHYQRVSIAYEASNKNLPSETVLELYLSLMLNEHNFYKQIYKLPEYDSFEKMYLLRTKENFLEYIYKGDISLILNDEKQSLLLNFFIHGFSSIVLEWIQEKHPCSPKTLANVITKSIPDSFN